jgi:hypothetical protein
MKTNEKWKMATHKGPNVLPQPNSRAPLLQGASDKRNQTKNKEAMSFWNVERKTIKGKLPSPLLAHLFSPTRCCAECSLLSGCQIACAMCSSALTAA